MTSHGTGRSNVQLARLRAFPRPTARYCTFDGPPDLAAQRAPPTMPRCGLDPFPSCCVGSEVQILSPLRKAALPCGNASQDHLIFKAENSLDRKRVASNAGDDGGVCIPALVLLDHVLGVRRGV
jgi:hypothetical protein